MGQSVDPQNCESSKYLIQKCLDTVSTGTSLVQTNSGVFKGPDTEFEIACDG